MQAIHVVHVHIQLATNINNISVFLEAFLCFQNSVLEYYTVVIHIKHFLGGTLHSTLKERNLEVVL